jgi:hypothetical protein
MLVYFLDFASFHLLITYPNFLFFPKLMNVEIIFILLIDTQLKLLLFQHRHSQLIYLNNLGTIIGFSISFRFIFCLNLIPIYYFNLRKLLIRPLFSSFYLVKLY